MFHFDLRSTDLAAFYLRTLVNEVITVKSFLSNLKTSAADSPSSGYAPCLPPEILACIPTETISDLLNTQRLRCLRSAALVSREWRYEAQRLLHQSVVLDSDERAYHWLTSSARILPTCLEFRGMDVSSRTREVSLPVIPDVLEKVGGTL